MVTASTWKLEQIPLPSFPPSWRFSFTSIFQVRPEAVGEAFLLFLVRKKNFYPCDSRWGYCARSKIWFDWTGLDPAVSSLLLVRLDKKGIFNNHCCITTLTATKTWGLRLGIEINRSWASAMTRRASTHHLSVEFFEVLEFQRRSVHLITFRIGTEAKFKSPRIRTALFAVGLLIYLSRLFVSLADSDSLERSTMSTV